MLLTEERILYAANLKAAADFTCVDYLLGYVTALCIKLAFAKTSQMLVWLYDKLD